MPKFKDMDEKLQQWFYSRNFFFFFKIKKKFGKKKNNREIRVRKLEILLKIKGTKEIDKEQNLQ